MNTLAASPSNDFLPAVWKLLRLRILISINTFKHARTIRKILTIVGYLTLLGVGVGLLYGSWLLLGFLRSPQLSQYAGMDVTNFLQAIPVMILTILFMGILLTSFGVLLQALYLSGDMDFLLASPVPIRAVFASKLLQAVLPNFGLITLFGIPVLFGLGLADHANILYYPLVLVIMIALALAGAGIAALLVMLVVRIMSPRRAAEILGFIGATLGILCGQIGNIGNAFGLWTKVSGSQVNNLFTLIQRFNTPWFPLNWAGQGLVAVGQSRWGAGLLLVALTLGLTSVVFLFALAMAERWYYTGWARMQVVPSRKKTVRNLRPAVVTPAAAPSRVGRLLPAPIRAILWKDSLVFRRDVRNLSLLVSPVILGIVYTGWILRLGGQFPAGQGQAPALFMSSMNFLLAYSSVGMSLFVGWILIIRLAGMAFSSEGKNYWILKSSPVRTAHLLVAKFLVAFLPAFGLGLIFLVLIALVQKMTPVNFLYSLLAVVMCLAGMTGLLLGFGAAGARFDWDDPRKMNAGSTGCLGQIITAVFLPLAFGLFIGPLWLVSFFHWPLAFGYLAGGIVGIAVTALAALLSPWLVRKKVERLNES
jgi:ABC-2 type transport system permease protein